MPQTDAVPRSSHATGSGKTDGLLSLRESVAIVTGASTGIGAAIAHDLARRGARVVLAARGPQALQEQAGRINAAGGNAIAIPADISKPGDVERLIAGSLGAFGEIDILVNNAAIGWHNLLAHSSREEICQIVEINLVGAMLVTRAVLPEMLTHGRGAIINIGSVSGRVAVDPLYSATKYGIRGFSLSLRRQLASSGISVSLVSPGKIRTNQNRDCNEPMDEPEVVARTVARLVTKPRREVVVPRKYHAMVWIEQGMPGFADRAQRWRHRKYEVAPCKCAACTGDQGSPSGVDSTTANGTG
jgi:short-subunit dehydrogenase